jgi:hypothetical protein
MTKPKNTKKPKPKRIKQKIYTTKGKPPLKAVSSDLLIQQSETSKSIKNYNTAGINYDKKIYNKLIRNMEAQKIASQSNDPDLKIKLKNYGDSLRSDLKKSVGKKRVTIPQDVQANPIYRSQSQQQQADQQQQAASLTGDGLTVLAEMPTAVNVEDQTTVIKNLLKAKQYDSKEPKENTIGGWAVKYGLSKGQIKAIVANDKIEKLDNITKLNKAKSSSIESKPKTPSAAPMISTKAKNKIIRAKIADFPPGQKFIVSVKQRIVKSKPFKDNQISIADFDKVVNADSKKKRVVV